ncbi:MAG: DUF92 domain-containing protein [Chloroflexota bacterium]
MSERAIQFLAGLAFSALLGGIGYWRGALSRSGVLGALIVGTLMYGFGGLSWAVLLVAFFASSSALSFYRQQDKISLTRKLAKGQRRDLGQALANGGLAAALALGAGLYPHLLWFVAAVGALATVNADTWATELGVLSPARPRLITTGQPVEPGTSGGVTVQGSAAALAGALFISLTAAGLWLAAGAPEGAALRLAGAGAVAGVLGSLADSLLGATVQVVYICDCCNEETEQAMHRCGQPTRYQRGWRWLNNDGVNFLSSVIGALIALVLA